MVKQRVLIDTNIFIDHLRSTKQRNRRTQLETIVSDENIILLIASSTIQELFAGQSSKKLSEERKIRKIFDLFNVVSFSSETAELAGKIMRDAEPVIQFADAQIAAIAITKKALLATRNKKDFINVKGIKFYD